MGVIKENPGFISFDNNTPGLIFDQEHHPRFPISYYNVVDGEGINPIRGCSYFVYIYEGSCTVSYSFSDMPKQGLVAGMYFSTRDKFRMNRNVRSFKAIVIEVHHSKGEYPKTNFSSFYSVGGPIESKGRLKYIDGCTDSLLIPPVKMGDPCLNHLHFPSGIVQTPHTHPSHRIGIVAKGEGECITPFGNLPLTQGMIFVIKEWDGKTHSKGIDGNMYPNGTHSFNTNESTMDVIAFHPDSDHGPTDVDHPMINRTIVDGVSASKLGEIQTE